MEFAERRSSLRHTVLGNVDHVFVIGLRGDTYYWFYVQVFNGAANGPPTPDYPMNTWHFNPLNYPLMIRVEKVARDTVKVSFVGITTTVLEEELDGYKVYISLFEVSCFWY